MFLVSSITSCETSSTIELVFFPYPAIIARRIDVQKKAIAKRVVALVKKSAVPLAEIKLLVEQALHQQKG